MKLMKYTEQVTYVTDKTYFHKLFLRNILYIDYISYCKEVINK